MNKEVIVDKTKIIATIGPASQDIDTLRGIIKVGADVCRLNFSHGSHAEHEKVINNIKKLNKELKTNVAILADLQGPKIRLGVFENNERKIAIGEHLCFNTKEEDCGKDDVFITYRDFARDVKEGEIIQVDDGKILLRVISTDRDHIAYLKVIHGEILRSRKGVNLPDTNISLPCLTKKDLIDLEFALKHEVHWVALSFVRSASDIIELQHIIKKHQPKHQPLIIAKIEKPEALEDIDSIIHHSDAIMVARGDLGIEIPIQKIPLTQKMLVKKCLIKGTPIIIATQMMEGMIDNFNPTRAEVNDVANSVMDGADALMLSGETSIGSFPIEVVNTMHKVIDQVETYEDIYYKYKFDSDDSKREVSDAIIHSACRLAQEVNARAIIGMTYSGYSALKIANNRPKANIFIFTENEHLLNKLNLIWGIRGFYYNKFISTDHSMDDIIYLLKKERCVFKNDKVVFISSTPLIKNSKTNMIKLAVVD